MVEFGRGWHQARGKVSSKCPPAKERFAPPGAVTSTAIPAGAEIVKANCPWLARQDTSIGPRGVQTLPVGVIEPAAMRGDGYPRKSRLGRHHPEDPGEELDHRMGRPGVAHRPPVGVLLDEGRQSVVDGLLPRAEIPRHFIIAPAEPQGGEYGVPAEKRTGSERRVERETRRQPLALARTRHAGNHGPGVAVLADLGSAGAVEIKPLRLAPHQGVKLGAQRGRLGRERGRFRRESQVARDPRGFVQGHDILGRDYGHRTGVCARHHAARPPRAPVGDVPIRQRRGEAVSIGMAPEPVQHAAHARPNLLHSVHVAREQEVIPRGRDPMQRPARNDLNQTGRISGLGEPVGQPRPVELAELLPAEPAVAGGEQADERGDHAVARVLHLLVMGAVLECFVGAQPHRMQPHRPNAVELRIR